MYRDKEKGTCGGGNLFDVVGADNIDASSRIETPAATSWVEGGFGAHVEQVVVVVIADADAASYSSTGVTHRRQPDEPAEEPAEEPA